MVFLDNASRIGEDECGLSQTNFQNAEVSNYMLKNFYLQDCGMKRPIEIATAQPNIFLSGGNGVGLGGCNVDDSSQLLLGKVQTNPKCRISLIERPYLTVPYLGRGNVDINQETFILQGEQNVNRRSINQLSEQSYMRYSNIPMIPSLQNSITDPSHIVENVADEGWVRGGVASRELQRDKNV